LQQEGLTEYRAGNYVYFDRTQIGLGAASIDDCALSVLARVVSKPASDRIILDSGSKTLTSDGARGFSALRGHGLVFAGTTIDPGTQPVDDLIVERLSEEHATVRVASGRTSLVPGDRVRIIPNHSCVVSNLVDAVWLTNAEQVLEPLPIAARGRIT
jgi:D-serine deaminase-like pyridoxal phosphate-dependent protein